MAAKLSVKVGDTVKVISGEDKNKKDNTGKVQKVFPETGRIIVEGINMVKKHQKPRGQMNVTPTEEFVKQLRVK